jgi:hypothetical protein
MVILGSLLPLWQKPFIDIKWITSKDICRFITVNKFHWIFMRISFICVILLAGRHIKLIRWHLFLKEKSSKQVLLWKLFCIYEFYIQGDNLLVAESNEESMSEIHGNIPENVYLYKRCLEPLHLLTQGWLVILMRRNNCNINNIFTCFGHCWLLSEGTKNTA